MKKICIVSNLSKDPVGRYVSELSLLLNSKGIENYSIIYDPNHSKEKPRDIIRLRENTDCVMVLGGDGTLLEAARDIVDLKIPLLGINLGRLGFLTDIEGSNLSYAVDKLSKNEYYVEKRMMVNGSINHNDVEIFNNIAFNDIVFSRSGQNQITSMELYVNGSLLNRYEADGLIISTPTGSTAYNHSAGGPVVEPTASMFVVTPVCSQILGIPSILLDGKDILEVRIPYQTRHPYNRVGVSFDGTPVYELEYGDRIRISKSDSPIEVVRFSRESFLETLRKKMQH